MTYLLCFAIRSRVDITKTIKMPIVILYAYGVCHIYIIHVEFECYKLY